MTVNLRGRVSPEPLAEVDGTEWIRICRCPAGALLAANLRARAAAGGYLRACASWHVLRSAGLRPLRPALSSTLKVFLHTKVCSAPRALSPSTLLAPRCGPPPRSPAATDAATSPTRPYKRPTRARSPARFRPPQSPHRGPPCRTTTTRDPTAVAPRSSPRCETPATASVQTPRNAEPEAADAGAAGGSS